MHGFHWIGASSVAAMTFALALASAGSQAIASAEPISDECRPHVRSYDSNIYAEPSEFDRKRQKGWYARWWTGRCDAVPLPDKLTCVPDEKKSWVKIVRTISEQAPADQRPAVVREACQLGELAGLEWAKDNNRRCLHTNDLQPLWTVLEDKRIAPLERINRVRTSIRAKLGCRG